jgi:hypothetical protein
MHIGSSCIGRLLSGLTIVLLIATISPSVFGQNNSTTASITLVARLESLSVCAAFPDDAGATIRQHDNSTPIPVLLTTSWAVSSNRTTVKISENGRALFFQAAVDSDRSKTRTDLFNVVLHGDRSEAANPVIQPSRVIILVQAL